MKPMQTKSFLQCISPHMAAVLLGICKSTVYRLIKDGTIPAVRLGRRLIIPLASIQALLDDNKQGVIKCPEENEKQPMVTVRSTSAVTGAGDPPSG